MLDGAIALLDGNQGVEPQTETVWRQADKYNVPRLIFVNKMDKIGADFYFCVDTLHKRLGIKTAIVQLPIGAENDFVGIVDLIEMNALIWHNEELGAAWDVVEIPDNLKESAAKYREQLIETVVEVDDAATEAYLNGEMPDKDTLRRPHPQGHGREHLLPGVLRLGLQEQGRAAFARRRHRLSAVADRHSGDQGHRRQDRCRDRAPCVRRRAAQHAGVQDCQRPAHGLADLLRIYSGHLEQGSMLENTVKEKRERVGRMFQMHANSREQINEAYAGDIVAIVGLKDTTTGDTLSDPNNRVILERMEFPEPVIDIAVEPKSKADQEKMGLALARLAAEDPSFRVKTDEESGQTIISGMGELHLDIIVDRMKREFKVEANIGAPQVAYREAITKTVEHDYTHKKQSGGSGQFARIKFRIEPNEPGKGFEFASEVVGGNVPKEYVPGVQKGVASVMGAGPLIGFPIVDVKFVLTDGAYHDVDSSVLAFEIAGRAGFREAIEKAAPKILEPIMRVEVLTPEDYVGDVIGDLNSRRGQIRGTEGRGIAQVIDAMVPLANMFGYVNSLRSMSQGRAQYTMTFDHYEQVPNAVAQEVQAKYA